MSCPGCGAPLEGAPRCSYCGRSRLSETAPTASFELFDRRPEPAFVKDPWLRAFLLRNPCSTVGDYERLHGHGGER